MGPLLTAWGQQGVQQPTVSQALPSSSLTHLPQATQAHRARTPATPKALYGSRYIAHINVTLDASKRWIRSVSAQPVLLGGKNSTNEVGRGGTLLGGASVHPTETHTPACDHGPTSVCMRYSVS